MAGEPIPLPQIQLKQFKPDVSKYHANKIARIRAIGERARQDRLRKEAYQRALAKEFREVNVDRYKFNTDFFQKKQAEMIHTFNSWAARQQASEGKTFSEAELLEARRYASDIDSSIEAMVMSEKLYKEDGDFVSKNLDEIDKSFYDAHMSYNPKEHGLYQDYLKKQGVKPKLRDIDSYEFADMLYSDIFKPDKANEFTEVYQNTHGDELSAEEIYNRFYEFDDNGNVIGIDPNNQIDYMKSAMGRYTRGVSGTMKEFDEMTKGLEGEALREAQEKQAFYRNLAKNGAMTGTSEGYYDTDFTGVMGTGDEKDAYVYYFYDKVGDDLFKPNKSIRKKSAELLTDKGYKKNGRKVPYLKDSSSVTYGDTKFDNVYRLSKGVQLQEGVSIKGAKRVSGGKLVDVGDITVDSPTIVATNVKDGKIDNVVLRYRTESYETTEGGDPIYVYPDLGLSGTEDEIFSKMKKLYKVDVSDADKGIYRSDFKRKKSDTPKYETVLAPAYENTYLTNEFGVKGTKGVYEPKKEITFEEMKEAARKAGYSVEEYRKGLEANGYKIIE